MRNIGRIQSNLRFAKDSVLAAKPDALILIDYPSFNLKVAAKAYKAGIPCIISFRRKCGHGRNGVSPPCAGLCAVFCRFCLSNRSSTKAEGAEAVYVGNPSVAEVAAEVAAADSRDVFLARHKLRDRHL